MRTHDNKPRTPENTTRTPESKPQADSGPLILTVSDDLATFEAIERILVKQHGLAVQLRWVRDLSMALARVAGGGVSCLLIDCSPTGDADTWLRRFPSKDADYSGCPAVLWLGPAAGPLPEKCRHAAEGWPTLTGETPVVEARQLWAEPAAKAAATPPARPGATFIAMMGVKGGVGTSTVAMNVASALTAKGNVILAELRSSLGSLEGHFRPGRLVRGIGSLADHEVALSSLLWPAPQPAGLRVLFGPQKVNECREWNAAGITGLLRELAGQSDYVVLDLELSFGEMNRAILAECDYLTLVMEPTQAGAQLGRLMVEGIGSWPQAPASVGAVLVKRRPEGVTLGPREIELELGVPILKSIPPAPESCLASEQGRIPLVEFDPESLVADCLLQLGCSYHPRERSGRARSNRVAALPISVLVGR